MLWVLKPQFVDNLTYRFVRVEYFFLGKVDKFILNVFLCGVTSFFFNQITKIIWG